MKLKPYLVLVFLCALSGACTAFGATFGTPVSVLGAASDLVLDEPRHLLYIVNTTGNRIDVYDTVQRRFGSSIPTDTQPVAGAISRNGKFLYITCFSASTLDVIDLDAVVVVKRVSLPAAPEGIAVGADERALITMVGVAGTPNTPATNTMVLYNPDNAATASLSSVAESLPAPGTLAATANYNASRSHLVATPDGRLIIGLNNPTTTTRSVFVFETVSGSVLRSRTLTNVSSEIAVSPDGKRFMAGLSLFDTDTLAILAQQNAANSAYAFAANVNFNTQQNQGGSLFSPDGSVLYTAFNIAPQQTPAARANVGQMMLNDPENLLIRLGIQMPENLSGKMVSTADGSTLYALSQSGFTILPVSTIYNNPIAVPDASIVLLAKDQCGLVAQKNTARVMVRNKGKGRFNVTAQVQATGPAANNGLGGGGGAGGGFIGGGIIITFPGGGFPGVLPGGFGPGGNAGPGGFGGGGQGNQGGPTTAQQAAITGSAPQLTIQPQSDGASLNFTINPSATASLGSTLPSDFTVQSNEAINIPPLVRVIQNSRNSEADGDIMPVNVGASTAEGLVDIVADTIRKRVYLANSGMNQVEVFDMVTKAFLSPIKVGQLPRSLALTPDGSSLYVANTGGESISIIDLDKAQVSGKVKFPALPYNASSALITPSTIVSTLQGLQMVMSNGSLWKTVNNEALPRPSNGAVGTAATLVAAPRSMIATPGGEFALLLGGDGRAYLYDANVDDYVISQTVVSAPIQGFFGPLAAGPRGQYFVVNDTILNQSLTPVSTSGISIPGITTGRPISTVTPLNSTTYLRFVQPTRASTSAVVTSPPSIEVVDIATGFPRGGAPALEGPLTTQVGTQRVNVSARSMATDATGSTAYMLTAGGLSVVPLNTAAVSPQSRPAISTNGIVNLGSYTTDIAQGSIVSMFGRNLGAAAQASTDPLPTVLGGSCVTLDNTPLPLFMTSGGQVNLQIPASTTAGRHSLVVRAVDQKVATQATSITVVKYAPAILVDTATLNALVFHQDGTQVDQSNPAHRDEPIVMYAIGLGLTKGAAITTGRPTPSSPLSVSDKAEVFFGNPKIKEAGIIVDWSGLVPGSIGLYQLNLRVPGAHLSGDALPALIRIGGVDSAKTGPAVPHIAVN